MIVACNRCNEEFDSLIHEQEKTINNKQIYRTYLECPKCGSEYTISYDTMSTLALKKQIRKLMLSPTNNNPNQLKRKEAEVTKKTKRLEKELLILKAKYHKHFEN